MALEKYLIEGERAADHILSVRERLLANTYKESLDSIRSQIAEAYAKYALGNALTYADMARYNRLITLFDNINGELKRLTGQTENMVLRLQEDVYNAGYYHTAYALERGGQVKLSFGLLPTAAIEASIQNPISGLTLSERLASRRVEIVSRIRQEVTQGLIQGESYPQMARRIKGAVEGDYQKALRIARTEGHRNMQAGRTAAMDWATDRGI
jgi:hypothetical protein